MASPLPQDCKMAISFLTRLPSWSVILVAGRIRLSDRSSFFPGDAPDEAPSDLRPACSLRGSFSGEASGTSDDRQWDLAAVVTPEGWLGHELQPSGDSARSFGLGPCSLPTALEECESSSPSMPSDSCSSLSASSNVSQVPEACSSGSSV